MVDVKDIDLRDWFAGQALGGLLSNTQFPPQTSGEPLDQFVARVTESAYRIAESMIQHGRRLRQGTSSPW
jgi:hypothetical protein